LISATNRDLEQMIEDNEFRLDVYHRINAFEIHLPPLRERGDDIDLLVSHFIRQLSKKLDRKVEGVSPEAMKIIRDYEWPGNVRELRSVIRRSMLMATGPVIVPENLSIEFDGQLATGSGTPAVSTSSNRSSKSEGANDTDGIGSFVQKRIDAGSNDIYAESLAMMESTLIRKILMHTSGNQSKAAEILGITRGSLRTKIRSLNIVIEQVVTSDS